ncbi:hypothetical protein V6O07_08615, partial [Arthrospira platensis SPKY2]
LNEQVDMIGFAVAFGEGATKAGAGIPRNLAQAFEHGSVKNLAAVLGYENQVAVDCVNCVAG